MPDTDDILARVQAGLDDRYELVRQIGIGGMAIVYLANERRHARKVAIKVLRPELAAAVGAERFLREIAVVASFEHPHIAALYDSGSTDGLPYFVMPFIEGKSLEEVIRREKQLPLDDVVELTRQIASALDYAHAHGIVHRDIKPQNILMSSGQALVADFGIARAIAAAGSERLTSTGLAVGSLHYMSPEQASGSDEVDHRSDIYSLGCVAYEMLVGEPPFRGSTPHALIARHSFEPVPDLRIVRNTISIETELVVKKALAKVPADRFRSASEFAAALRRSVDGSVRPPEPVRWWSKRTILVGIGVIAVATAAVMLVDRLADRSAQRLPVRDIAVAVLPFRFSGFEDSAVFSPAGLVGLLSTRLINADVIDAVDPTAVLRESARRGSADWSEAEALRVARSVGASMALIGTAYRTGSRITIDGSLVGANNGKIIYRVPEVTGPIDSVASTLDRFATHLLLFRAGEAWRGPGQLTTDRFDAVRAYVAGLVAYRRGRYEAAAQHFERALTIDPRFVLARVKLGMVHSASGDIESEWRAFGESWEQRGRLARDDSVMLDALVSERIPESRSYAEQMKGLEWVVDSLPNAWEASYALGDMLLHWGPMLGTEVPHQRARAAFERTLAVDSGFAPSLEHLIDLAVIGGDLALANRLGDRYLTMNVGADHADYVRWRLAAGDSARRHELRRGFGTANRNVLEQIAGMAQLDGVAMEDAVAATAELKRRARNDSDLWWTTLLTTQLALNRGRPQDIPEEKGRGRFRLPLDSLFRTIEAAYWTHDEAEAARLVRAHVATADRAAAANVPPSSPQYMWTCIVGLWRSASGRALETHNAIAQLQSARGAEAHPGTMYIPVCAATLEARYATIAHLPNASAAVSALDSLLRSGPVTNPHIRFAARVTLADLREQSGDFRGALRAVRQRPYHHLTFGITGLSELLLREARLATRVGDTLGAVRAYQHYLALRGDPAPQFRKEVGDARSALRGLQSAGQR